MKNRLGLVLFLLSTLFLNTSLVLAHTCQPYLNSSLPENLGPLVSWKKLIPGQSHYGKYIVENYDFQKPLKIIELENLKVLNKAVPVIQIQTLKQSYYLLKDNHHTLMRFVKSNNSKKELFVPISITDTLIVEKLDYKVMQDLIDKGLIWSKKKITPEWNLKKDWPQNILQLKDLPMRSLIQFLFFELNLSGKSFTPYMQFNLAEILIENGFEFNPKYFQSTKNENKAKSLLFDYINNNPQILTILKDNIVANDNKQALEKIVQFEDTFKK